MKNTSDRHQNLTLGSACVAAALFHLAGATVALGQNSQPANTGLSLLPQMPKPAADAGQPAGAEKKPSAGTRVKVDDNNLVDLHVNDEDLGTVLEMLSIQSQRNIIASKNVSARVTANLYRVTFFEALDAILNVNGYGHIENGNFIMIYTLDELRAIQAAQRQRISKVVPLNYLNSTDAAEMVKPLLSIAGPNGEAGQIKTNGKVGTFPTPGDVPMGNEEYANSSMLVVYDYEENVREIEELLRQLDTRPAQVLVEATILQTSLTEDNALGVDFSVIADANFSEFVNYGGALGVVNGLISGRSTPGGSSTLPSDGGATGVTSTVGNTAGKGGFKIGVVSNDVAVFIRMLDEVTDTTILSNPKLLAMNRQASRVLVGRKVGYLSTTSTDTATTQTVQFLDTGTQLYFRPFVMNDGMIRMELKPQVSEAVIRDSRDATGAAVTIPDEITNELTTNVMVRDGQTVVLGGLFRESTESARRQVPFLGDIPVIGRAFRGNDDSTERNEIIFMITPHVMNDTALTAQGDRAKDQAGRVLAGAREGTLFWSRDKLTTALNVEAEKLTEQGRNDKAMWYVQRSLAMNPQQPEAIGLREKLATEKMSWPSRSVLQRIVDSESNTVIKKVGSASVSEDGTVYDVASIPLPYPNGNPAFTQPTEGNTVTASNTNSFNTSTTASFENNTSNSSASPNASTTFNAATGDTSNSVNNNTTTAQNTQANLTTNTSNSEFLGGAPHFGMANLGWRTAVLQARQAAGFNIHPTSATARRFQQAQPSVPATTTPAVPTSTDWGVPVMSNVNENNQPPLPNQ